jgi:hypothetical protein
MGEETPRGQSRPDLADLSSESGWITTEVAAKAVRVSPRTIRRYIDQGKLEAKPQGEGVHRTWLVSVDSLHALRAARTFEEPSPRADRTEDADNVAASIADVLREMSARLERRAEEAAELRVRLELTERAQSTLEDERRRALEELTDERRRREEIEAQLGALRRELDEWRRLEESAETTAHEIHDRREDERSRVDTPSEPSEFPELRSDRSIPTDRDHDQETPSERPKERSWWRRMFGGS